MKEKKTCGSVSVTGPYVTLQRNDRMNRLKINPQFPYVYETHLHTSEASACARNTGDEMARACHEAGYTGIMVTNHFYYGNTAIDRGLDWNDFVTLYCEGYKRVKAEGDKRGFSVFFGIEQRFKDGHDEYIVLGLTPEWIMAHPEMRDMGRDRFFDLVREAGGFTIQAHPFREASYIRDIKLVGKSADAIEVFNSCNTPESCRRAYEYAKNLGMNMVGGSDIHHKSFSKEHSGIAVEKKLHDVKELINVIKSGEYEVLPIGKIEEISKMPLEDPALSVFRFRGDSFEETKDYYH